MFRLHWTSEGGVLEATGALVSAPEGGTQTGFRQQRPIDGFPRLEAVNILTMCPAVGRGAGRLTSSNKGILFSMNVISQQIMCEDLLVVYHITHIHVKRSNEAGRDPFVATPLHPLSGHEMVHVAIV